MSPNGDALLLDRDFIALRMSFFENKVNENEFSWVSYFSLLFVTLSLHLKYSLIHGTDWPSKFGSLLDFRVFLISAK